MKYFSIEPKDNTFPTLHLELSHRCNMNCHNCYLPNREIEDLDFNRIVTFLKELPRRVDVRLIGGEPTLYRELPELIKKIRKLGHRPILISNGLKLANYEYFLKLKQNGLRRVSISMNGANDELAYSRMEEGPKGFHEMKISALKNAFKLQMFVNTHMIVINGINDHLMKSMIDMVDDFSKYSNRSLSLTGYPIICRFKTLGQIGRYMSNSEMSFNNLKLLAAKATGVPLDVIDKGRMIEGKNEENVKLFPLKVKNGSILIKLTDWNVYNDSVPDKNSKRRGRITENWKIAPCFEDIKKNEFGF